MTGTIPFARESWVAVNLYAMRTDGRQTLTLDGVPPPNYDPQRAVELPRPVRGRSPRTRDRRHVLLHQDQRARATGHGLSVGQGAHGSGAADAG